MAQDKEYKGLGAKIEIRQIEPQDRGSNYMEIARSKLSHNPMEEFLNRIQEPAETLA
jgi:hypothetical protein